MPITASQLPHSPDQDKYLKREIAEITDIYKLLFDDRNLEFVLSAGTDPLSGDALVFEDHVTFRPHHLQSKLLKRENIIAPNPHARAATIVASIPPIPTQADEAIDRTPWQPPRKLRPLYRLSPLLYENIRYIVEMRRRRLAATRHNWKALPGPARASDHLAPIEHDKRPAILIGFHFLEVGGAEKMAFDTVEMALKAGLRVFVVAGVPALQRLSHKLPDHPDVKFIRLDRYLPQEYWPRYVEKLITKENIRLVHIHHCTPLYDNLAHIRITSPQVGVIDSTHITEYSDGGYARVSRVWENFIDTHHVISNQLNSFYDEKGYTFNKVRLGRMLARDAQSPDLPAPSLTAGKKTINIAFIGRYQYQKRPLLIAYIMKQLASWSKQNKIEVRAKFVGEGVMRPATETLIRRFGLQGIVEFLPANSDVAAILDQSDILLLPSNNEGLALVCYEAIRHGCIPISTNVGGQSEIIPSDLLVPLAPTKAIRSTVSIVKKLWSDQNFIDRQHKDLHRLYNNLSADPTAEDVLFPIYQAAAQGKVLPL